TYKTDAMFLRLEGVQYHSGMLTCDIVNAGSSGNRLTKYRARKSGSNISLDVYAVPRTSSSYTRAELSTIRLFIPEDVCKVYVSGATPTLIWERPSARVP